MDSAYAELEIGLHRVQRGTYEVTLRLTDPDSQAEVAPVRGMATLDAAALLVAQSDPAAYGRLLARQVLADPAVRALYARARAVIDREALQLRIRVAIDRAAPELHDLRWELLRDPDSDAPLATSERVLLSRFMRSDDWRPIRLRPRARLRAVIAVAAPSDAGTYDLANIDVAAEVTRARAAMPGLESTVIGQQTPCTLDALIDALRPGIDVLYLVCHGVLTPQGESVLFLQTASGAVARVRGMTLAGRIAELTRPPRLVALASCESAGRADTAALTDARSTAEASLAPLLADAGVPAVLAMQGQIHIDTAAIVMPRFFRELLTDGQIDRALAVARGAARARSDHWMPALYLRLKGGRLWYEPGISGDAGPALQWKRLCAHILDGQFVPILGPNLDEELFGGTRALAERVADAAMVPASERTDLARVTQYLAIARDRTTAQQAVQRGITDALARHAPAGPPLAPPQLLGALAEQRKHRDDDPHALLARLPAAIYVTASPETLLSKSIRAAGRNPEVVVCRWRATRRNRPMEPRLTSDEPTVDAPLVYHVFGVLGDPESLVLTEDDFFDFLVATSAYKLMPRVVRGALSSRALLLLGFRLDDWSFRVLFRLIMNQEGTAGLGNFTHVGVQVSPEEYSLAEVDQARRHLERYFGGDRGAPGEPPISVYWGSATDFLRELLRRVDDARQAEAPPPAAEEAGGGWF